MRRWLARLSFSFFVLAAVLVYDGYRGARGQGGRALTERQVQLRYAGAVVCIGLGIAGTRARHAEVYGEARDDRRDGE